MVHTERVIQTDRSARAVTPPLRQRLADAAGTDGGWGYYRGQSSRLEPTAWAVMALGATGRAGAPDRRATSWSRFEAWQRADGLLVESNTPGPNYAWNGLALLALGASSSASDQTRSRLIAALLNAKGVQLAPERSLRQNNALQAWPWIDGTFSWSEPTAWCLLALKKTAGAGGTAKARIAEADELLVDRMCQPAGWNYGNAAAFTQDLRPYVPTTALVLLAMQDRRDRAEIVRSVDWLEAHATTERSAMALALAAIALHVFGRPADAALSALVQEDRATAFLNNAHLTAMALYALTIPEHGAQSLRIG
jgi:hypothetical protein